MSTILVLEGDLPEATLLTLLTYEGGDTVVSYKHPVDLNALTAILMAIEVGHKRDVYGDSDANDIDALEDSVKSCNDANALESVIAFVCTAVGSEVCCVVNVGVTITSFRDNSVGNGVVPCCAAE